MMSSMAVMHTPIEGTRGHAVAAAPDATGQRQCKIL
jgi:hypothetical protein